VWQNVPWKYGSSVGAHQALALDRKAFSKYDNYHPNL
jgi:hypothetical protein